MSSSHSIFADPRGRRRRCVQISIVVMALLLLGASAYFVSSLLVAPQLRLPQEVRTYRTSLKAFKDPGLLQSKDDWHYFLLSTDPLPFSQNTLKLNAATLLLNPTVSASSKQQEHHTPEDISFPICLGYAVDWDAPSLFSLKRHGDLLTHVATDWFSLVGVEGKLVEKPSEEIRSFCAHKNLGLLPILRNIDGETWQPEAIEGLFKASQEEQNNFIDDLIKRLPEGSKGLLIDWNELDPSYRTELNELLLHLGNKLHQAHYEFWITIPAEKGEEVYDLTALSQLVDHFVLTLYDQSSEPDEPGPLAAQEWVKEGLQRALQYGKPQQWVAGLGTYGLDWNKTKETVETLSFVDVMARANLATADHITIAPPHFAPSFHYLSGPDEQEEHEIWFLDAITFLNQLHVIAPYHVGGIALNRLGEEDPDVWKALELLPKMKEEKRDEPTAEELEHFETLSLKEEVASIGSGDFLSVGEEVSEGWRQINLESTGLISSTYEEFPRPACVYHQGAGLPHQVAITFDDGPDPTWTPRILHILKEKKAPASFFILGSQAQQFPDLVQEIVQQGHELGNHTYTHQNLGTASDEQIYLELNATTRLIESITGHSTSLFRPPYNGDANPSTRGELRALSVASDLGYLTVGESVDTSDWECPGVQAILERVKEQRAAGGNIILLHDAGGNRAQTIAALPLIIDYLRARGDEIVPLSRFIGLPRDTLMPPLRHADVTVAMRYIYGSFATLRFLETAAWTFLIIATLLSLLYILFFIACALRHRQREAKKAKALLHGSAPAPQTSFEENHSYSLPPLSVIIAAYNEERVIGSTIQHLLASDYTAPLELIIIDDGSQDNTAEAVVQWVRKHSSVQRKVILHQQPNSGKATALNHAIALSQYDYIVTLDADTMVTPQALRFLMEPFKNPHVGAVSGHIRVGNFRHWLGRFQQIEYEFAFEINRRAQDLLQCITVVPGALSAFRRSALLKAGPLNTETLAEDTDLTLQLHRLHWQITYAPLAIADTEAPQKISALFSQRFRWAFGTLQCLWKHRSLTFNLNTGWLGWLALPSMWIFQLGIIALTPLLDLLVLISMCFGRGKAIWPYFFASLCIDMGIAALSAYFAKRSPWSGWRALLMRFIYRPVLGYVVWKCLFKAAAGSWVRWKKLERTAAAIKEKEVSPKISPSEKVS